ncbi:MAG: hypothetical protein O6829_03100 [Alphaproteobacteria bacterium]|nr:hypothetical protein [Alphaproteobacteria bacterium]
MKTILLVTWMVWGQPPSSYQALFDSMDSCHVAGAAILQDLERIKAQRDQETARILRQPGIAGYNPGPAPAVSAVCVSQ